MSLRWGEAGLGPVTPSLSRAGGRPTSRSAPTRRSRILDRRAGAATLVSVGRTRRGQTSRRRQRVRADGDAARRASREDNWCVSSSASARLGGEADIQQLALQQIPLALPARGDATRTTTSGRRSTPRCAAQVPLAAQLPTSTGRAAGVGRRVSPAAPSPAVSGASIRFSSDRVHAELRGEVAAAVESRPFADGKACA